MSNSNDHFMNDAAAHHWSMPVVGTNSPTYTWADETLDKHQTECSMSSEINTSESITSANNPVEVAEIKAGTKNGRRATRAFDDAWKGKKGPEV